VLGPRRPFGFRFRRGGGRRREHEQNCGREQSLHRSTPEVRVCQSVRVRVARDPDAGVRRRPTGNAGAVRTVALALLLLLCGCGGSASVQKQAEDLHSVAAEGALLAHDAAEGETTGPFTTIHARELRKAAAKLEQSARSPRVEQLAATVVAALERLERTPGDEAGAAAIEQRLTDAADAAERIGRDA